MVITVSETLMSESLPSDLIPHLIAAEMYIEGASQPNYFREAFTENFSLVGANGVKLSVPYSSTRFTAGTISEGDLDSSGYTVTNLGVSDYDVTIGNQVYVAFRLSQILLEDQPNIAWLRVHLRDASRAIAEYLDNSLKTVAIAGVGNTEDAAVFGTLDKDDIIDLLAQMKSDNYFVETPEPPLLYLHPDQEADLLKDNDFLNTMRYRAGSLPQMVGEVSEPLWAGCRIRITSGMTQALGLIVFPRDNRGAATSVLAWKRPESVRTQDEVLYGRNLWVGSVRFGSAILSSTAVGLISGC